MVKGITGMPFAKLIGEKLGKKAGEAIFRKGSKKRTLVRSKSQRCTARVKGRKCMAHCPKGKNRCIFHTKSLRKVYTKGLTRR